MLERRIKLSRPLSLRMTLGALRHGLKDPTIRITATSALRATRTSEGPATLLLDHSGDELRCKAWGAGAERVIDDVPLLIGEHQRDNEFVADHPVVNDLHHRLQGLRVPRGGNVFESLLPIVIEQRVTGLEAKRAYWQIVRTFGEPAPGPPTMKGLMLAPTPERLAGVPSWALHRFGIERKRAEALRVACRVAQRLEECLDMDPADAQARLLAVPGIGPWTSNEVAFTALGDADAVTVGDYHHPNTVSWALAREPRGTDDRMLELLAPYKGQRGRVLRMIVVGCGQAPKYGPKYAPIPIASY